MMGHVTQVKWQITRSAVSRVNFSTNSSRLQLPSDAVMNDPLPAGQPLPPSHFQATRWTLVIKARGKADGPEAKKALDALCRAYWYPLYAFARRQGHSPHDAQDLTQGFFAYLLEKDLFASADPNLGRLRTFLLTAFTRYVTREYVHSAAQKRGGGRKIESLDEEFSDGERTYRLEPADPVTPEQLFDRSWAQSLISSARKRLELSEAAEGRGQLCQVLGPFIDQHRDPAVTYESCAAQLGMAQPAVRKAVSRLRDRYRDAVREEISHTLKQPSEADIDNEMQALSKALG